MSSFARCVWNTSLAACAAACVSMYAGATGTSTVVVYSEDFAGGGGGGYAVSSLWHVALLSDCTPAQPGYGLYFGQDSPLCDFATGSTESGGAVSPGIDLTTCVPPITLTFDYRIGTEGLACLYDISTLLVSDDGFSTSVIEADPGCGAPTTLIENGGWLTATVDLSAWAGSIIQLSFGFNSVDSAFNGFFGFAVTNIEIEATKTQRLTLEGVDCQDDVDPIEPGHQIAVELWMRGVGAPGATGYQAFVEFDDTLLTYRDDLSGYIGPFPLHILNFGAAPPFNIEWAAGRLRLDGSSLPFDPPTAGDWQLATLVFDVLHECATTSLDFGGYPAIAVFFPELSLYGVPLPTKLLGTGSLRLDDTDPVITCPADITVAADVNVPICAGSDCCTTHAPGCSDGGCTAMICGFDPFCCNVFWDGICASNAANLCGPALAPCLGATVTFTVTATDICDPFPIIFCSHLSGDFFPIGTTTVTCTAFDSCGNSDTCSFDITVTATNQVLVDVKILVGSVTAPSALRCIHFQTEDCSAMADETLLFFDDGLGNQVTGPVFIEVPCGDWSSLCAKDEQHTKWDNVLLTRAGTYWVAAPQICLLPGDDDNDGDVDINDVTWLIFTFGSLAGPDPCPFVFPGPGPRDADFSLNGAVLAEDYSLLSDQFLTFSSCACALPAMGGPEKGFEGRTSLHLHEIDAQVRDHVDLNGDGMFDTDDVRIFEMLRGLPDTLSSKMRGEPRAHIAPEVKHDR